MPIRLATHLYRNRHGMFYFRFVVPKDLKGYLHKCELRFSLKTEQRHDAIYFAAQIIVDLPRLAADLRRMKNDEETPPPDYFEQWRAQMFVKPNDALTLYNLGIAYSELGRFEDAVMRLSKAVQLDSNYVNAWVGIGVAYARLNRINDAMDALKKAVFLDPGNGYAHRNLGALLSKENEYQKALPHFREAFHQLPDDPQTIYGLANCLTELGEIAEADKLFLVIIDRFPAAPVAEMAREGRTRIAHKNYRLVPSSRWHYCFSHINDSLFKESAMTISLKDGFKTPIAVVDWVSFVVELQRNSNGGHIKGAYEHLGVSQAMPRRSAIASTKTLYIGNLSDDEMWRVYWKRFDDTFVGEDGKRVTKPLPPSEFRSRVEVRLKGKALEQLNLVSATDLPSQFFL